MAGEPMHPHADERTRAAYDRVAADYAELLRDELVSRPFDRAVLGAFAELVLAAGAPGPVVDLGCGPGRITHHLHELGIDAFGVDLSPAMVNVARATYPHLTFHTSSMASLHGIADGALAGVVAWYSIIHTPPRDQPARLREVARVLRPAAPLLLAFQVGDDEHVLLDAAYGHPVDLDVYRLQPDRVAADLAAAGFVPVARTITEPAGRDRHPQAFLVVRREG